MAPATSPPFFVNRTLVFSNGTVLPGNFNATPGTVTPEAVGFDDADGLVWIGGYNQTEGIISLVNPTTATVQGFFVVGNEPQGILYDPLDHDMFVDITSSSVVDVFNASTAALLAQVPVGTIPQSTALDPKNGEIFVADYGSQNISIIDGTTLKPIGSVSDTLTAVAVAYDPWDQSIYVADGTGILGQLNATTHAWVGNFSVGYDLSAVACDSANGDVYTTDVSVGTTYIYDPKIVVNVSVTAVKVGASPTSLAYDPASGSVFVTNEGGGNVSVINTTTERDVLSLNVGPYPEAIGLDPENGYLYTAQIGGYNSTIIDGTTLMVVGSTPLSVEPTGLALDPAAGLLFVTDEYTDQVLVYNETTLALVDRFSYPAYSYPSGALYVNETGRVYVDEGGVSNVSVIDPKTETITATLTTGNYPSTSCYDPENHELYSSSEDGNITAVDPETGALSGTFEIANETSWVTCNTDNGEVYVPNYYSGGNPDRPHFGDGILTIISPISNTITGNVTVGLSPTSSAFDPQNDLIYVSNEGSDDVSIVSGITHEVVGTIGVPAGSGNEQVVYMPYRNEIYLLSNSNLTVINATREAVVSVINVGVEPASLVYDSSRRDAFLVNVQSGTLTELSAVAAPYKAVSINSFLASPATLAKGRNVTLRVSVGGGLGPDTYAYSGLPAGCTSKNTSVLTCEPTVVGTFAVGVTVTTVQNATAVAATSFTVVSPVTASIAFNSPNTGPAPLTVSMTGNGSGGFPPYTYAWRFGDSGTGSGLSVTHTYDSPDNYTVTLEVTDARGDTGNATAPVHVVRPAAFQSSILFESPSLGYAPLTVVLRANETGGYGPYSYAWNFGDGTQASGLAVAHTYSSLPTGCTTTRCDEVVTLTILDALGQSSSTQSIVTLLQNGSPTFSLTINETPGSGTAPLPVSFTVAASGGTGPYAYAWSFGNGATGAGPRPNETYLTPGTYTVLVTATDAPGDVAQISSTVVVNPAPPANTTGALNIVITATPSTGPAPLTTTLTAAVTGGKGPYNLTWFLGDGSRVGNATSVTHTYEDAGSYAAILTVGDAAGDHASTAVFVRATGPGNENDSLAAFVTVLSMTGIAPFVVTCTPSVTGGFPPYNLAWNFGDGTPIVNESSLDPVNHTYTQAGRYYPILTVTDSRGDSHVWSSNRTGGAATPVEVSGPAQHSTTGPGGSGLSAWLVYGVLAFVVASLASALIIGKRKAIFR